MKDSTLFQISSELHEGMDIGMCSCGKRIQTKNHKYGPDKQDYYLFVLVNRGEATLHYKGGEAKLRAHDLLVMCPGETLSYVAETPWSIQWVGLYGQIVERYLKALGIDGEHPLLSLERYHEVEEVLEALYLVSDAKTEYAEARQLELIFRFFSLLLFKSSAPVRYDIAEGVRKIIDYNFERELTVESLADTMHIASAYLTRKFKESFGIAPKAYLIEKRISFAKRLLVETDATVQEVASSVGYSDPLYFSRIFKKREGVSPLEFRKRARVL